MDTGQLVASCQGLVRSIAWKIHRQLPPYISLDDLVGYGQLGLVEAAKDYDPKHQTQFTTFAYYRIRGSILDGLSRLAWFNRADYVGGRYERIANEVLEPDPRPSSDAGCRDDQWTDDVRWLRNAAGALAVAYFMCHGAGGALADDVATDHPSPVENAITSELAAKVRTLIDALPSDARQLIQGAYFDGLSLKEAGERIGISKAWASRLHARTLQQLARALSAEND
jgi:RNA polymerase sigma factor FliA